MGTWYKSSNIPGNKEINRSDSLQFLRLKLSSSLNNGIHISMNKKSLFNCVILLWKRKWLRLPINTVRRRWQWCSVNLIHKLSIKMKNHLWKWRYNNFGYKNERWVKYLQTKLLKEHAVNDDCLPTFLYYDTMSTNC